MVKSSWIFANSDNISTAFVKLSESDSVSDKILGGGELACSGISLLILLGVLIRKDANHKVSEWFYCMFCSNILAIIGSILTLTVAGTENNDKFIAGAVLIGVSKILFPLLSDTLFDENKNIIENQNIFMPTLTV